MDMASQGTRARGSGQQNRTKPHPCKVFVGNISYRVTFRELSEFFSKFGPVQYAQIVKHHQKQWSRGIGFVTFKNAESAQLALDALDDDLILDDRVLRVSKPVKPKRRAAAEEVRGVKSGGVGGSDSEGVSGGETTGDDSGVSLVSNSEESSSQESKCASLNSDTLMHIFSYLHLKDRIVIERVCKSWQSAARLLWKTVRTLHFGGIFKSFTGKYAGLTDDILHSVLKRGCYGLRELDLSASSRNLTDFALDVIGLSCPKLERLDLSGVSVTTTSFKLLTQRCSGLKWLRLAGCHQVGEKGLWWALHNCSALESLDLTGNRRVTGQCFYLVGLPPSSGADVQCKGHLKTLILESCCFVTDEGISLLTQHTALVLEVVNISHCQSLSGAAVCSLATIRRMPEVDYIEEETMARGDQVPWHLDRLDQLTLPLNGRYAPLNQGEGVDIYILDSGIRYDHEEFENRAKYPGYDPTDDNTQSNRRGADCHGHGTHVASLAAGKTYGVAKKAQLYSVRVLGCDNSGPWSATLDGLDYVSRVIAERKRPAVVSMSLSGGFTRSVNDAVQNVYNRGITVVVAAGNQFNDACQRTPASSPYAITVGGSAQGDGIYGFTNYGRCVDIFAPGTNVRGADYRCPSCLTTISGTSMSTPMVSGAVAILLSREPLSSPSEVRGKLVSAASNNRLDFRSIPTQQRSVTPNRHLFTLGDCGGSFSAATQGSFKSPNNPGSYPPNLNCRWTITAAPGRTVQLDFTSFFVERNYDVVRICEGYACGSSSVIATLTGELTIGNRRYFSRGEVMTVELVTDGLNELQGIRASYSSTGTAQTPPPVPVTAPTVFSPPSTQPPLTQAPTTQPPTTPPTTIAMTTISLTTAPPTNATMPTTPPSSIIDTCNTNPLSPLLLTQILEEATVIVQKAVADSLSSLLERRVIGLVASYPALNCQQMAQVKAIRPDLTSGLYWVQASNGTAVQVYCDLDTTSKCGCSRSGWMRVADIDMRNSSQDCPPGLRRWDTPVRSCGRSNRNPGCSSTFISTNGVPYSRVCGKVIGYQYSSPNAFYAHQFDPEVTLDEYYVDGVSITHGRSPRHHVWTFAAARSEVDVSGHICPCTNNANTLPETAVPEFIGDNYFCDTGSEERYENGRFYANDPLWDGNGCGTRNSCCAQVRESFGYFCRDLGEVSGEDLELRSCHLLREFYFAGPNDNVREADLQGLGMLKQLEVLVIDRHVAFKDPLLAAVGRNCTRLRKLSCQACYDITDVGVACLSTCTQLVDLNLSYCHLVSDSGLGQLSEMGVLTRLIARACQGLSDEGLIHLAQKCLQLKELDICGCLSITNKTLYALQESLLHMREDCRTFSIVLGGTEISGDVAMQFATATGASISLHDLSVHSLCADYDPFMDIPPLYESWDSDDEPPRELAPLTSDPYEGFSSKAERSYLMDKAEDFLLADDPAIFSDEFSGGEDWDTF